MTAEQAVVDRLMATPGVTALIGSRIYPILAPSTVKMPVITFQRISTVRPESLRGPVGLANPRIQVDSWADSYDVAQALGKQVRMALDGYASDGVYSLILGEHDLMDPDGPRQRVTQDYSVWVDE